MFVVGGLSSSMGFFFRVMGMGGIQHDVLVYVLSNILNTFVLTPMSVSYISNES